MRDITAAVTAASAPGGRHRQKPVPDTAFSRWLRSSKMTVREVARQLDLSRWAIYNLRSGWHKPSLEVANRIADISGGKVPADSWGKISRKEASGKLARASRTSGKRRP